MCVRIRCDRCGKAGYAGCGAHVEQVLGGVPKEQRCRCRDEPATTKEGRPRLWQRLVGR